jgi:hypothetical protein
MEDAKTVIQIRGETRSLQDISRIYLAHRIIGDLLSDGVHFPLDVGVDDFLRNAYEQLTSAINTDDFKRGRKSL